MTIIFEDSEKQIVETTSPGWPDVKGSSRSRKTVWKPGSSGHVQQQREASRAGLLAKAQAALAANATYLGHAPVPGGTLTAAQLGVIVRSLTGQLDAATRQNNALIRLLLDLLDDGEDT